MKNNIQTIPGYRYNEYLLVLSPNEELREKILSIKKSFSKKYNAPGMAKSRPHITLVKFTQFEMMENRITTQLKNIAMGYQSFKVELNNFGSYPSHTIFINVTSKILIQNLVAQIKEVQRLMKLDNDHKPRFMDEPHLTIARKLLPWQYEAAWLEYSHTHFSGRFIADGMLLLKKRAQEKAFQIVQRFEFLNLPVRTKQGELFI